MSILKSSIKKALLPAIGVVALMGVLSGGQAQAAWEPTKTVEIIAAGGAGGGTDQLARLVQSIIIKYKFMPVSVVVINKGGGNGAEGFLEIKMAKGDANKFIVGTNNVYLLPHIARLGYEWKELTPIASLAQDDFILWGQADSPFKTAKEYIDAVKADPSQYRMGGSQSKDVDQTLTILLNQTEGTNFTYIPFKSGSEAATQLAGKHIGSNVNNPSENLSQWKAGQVKPMCVFSKTRMVYTDKVTDTMSWADIPTCREQGLKIEEYRFPRTVFMPGDLTEEQKAYYQDMLRKVTETPEFKEYVARNALAPTFMIGAELNAYIEQDEARAVEIFKDAGWLIK